MLISDSIKTTYQDNARYDVALSFDGEYTALSTIAVSGAKGLTDLLIRDGEMKTPEYDIEAYVTEAQDKLLHNLYRATVHTSYTDLRYPIHLSWGAPDNRHYAECYLADYTPATDVDFGSAQLLSVTLTLRPI